jgi:hypothetical protein
MNVLSYSPGQKVSLLIEVLAPDGYHIDTSAVPTIDKIFMPNLTLAAGFPVNTTKLDTGLYFYNFQLPTGISSVGSYVAVATWINPSTLKTNQTTFQINVSAPYGLYTSSPG